MIQLAFFLKPICLSLKNILLYLYLHKLTTAHIWELISSPTIRAKDATLESPCSAFLL